MTQAFNLSQFANKVNSSGLADLATAITGVLPVANGGTGIATLTANNVILGNGTSSVQAVAPSTSGNVLTSNGSTWVSSAIPAQTPIISSKTVQLTTSGTAFDFTSIPSWCKRITIMYNSVSTNGSSGFAIQIGAGSIQSSGYTGSSSQIYTAGASSGNANASSFYLFVNNPSQALSGSYTLTNLTGNTWVLSGVGSVPSATITAGGVVSLSGVLDRVRITTQNGSETFDSGSVNILYE